MPSWLAYQCRKAFRPKTIRNGDITLSLAHDCLSPRVRKALYKDGNELEEREIVGRNLAADDVVLEIGAGIGMITIICCKTVGSDRVHTFEANAAMEPALRKNFKLNSVSPHLEMKMVSLHGGQQDFFVAEQYVGSSRYHRTTSGNREIKETKVESVSFNSLMRQVRPTFLVVDIEGAEVDLADPSVDLQCVEKICVEVHPRIVGDEATSHLIGSLVARGFILRLSESRADVLYFERAKGQSQTNVAPAAAFEPRVA
ncbi:MAG: FkbM family methyltransferase [Candidatus Nealsonbacteria bacterium]|nr:FkbM family methyltransferase [Candidatus Nealsonbacteria bacterium]